MQETQIGFLHMEFTKTPNNTTCNMQTLPKRSPPMAPWAPHGLGCHQPRRVAHPTPGPPYTLTSTTLERAEISCFHMHTNSGNKSSGFHARIPGTHRRMLMQKSISFIKHATIQRITCTQVVIGLTDLLRINDKSKPNDEHRLMGFVLRPHLAVGLRICQIHVPEVVDATRSLRKESVAKHGSHALHLHE